MKLTIWSASPAVLTSFSEFHNRIGVEVRPAPVVPPESKCEKRDEISTLRIRIPVEIEEEHSQVDSLRRAISDRRGIAFHGRRQIIKLS